MFRRLRCADVTPAAVRQWLGFYQTQLYGPRAPPPQQEIARLPLGQSPVSAYQLHIFQLPSVHVKKKPAVITIAVTTLSIHDVRWVPFHIFWLSELATFWQRLLIDLWHLNRKPCRAIWINHDPSFPVFTWINQSGIVRDRNWTLHTFKCSASISPFRRDTLTCAGTRKKSLSQATISSVTGSKGEVAPLSQTSTGP